MARCLLKSIKAQNGMIVALTAANNTFPREYRVYSEKDTKENRERWKNEIIGGVVIPLSSCENNRFIKSLSITHYFDGKPFNKENRRNWAFYSTHW